MLLPDASADLMPSSSYIIASCLGDVDDLVSYSAFVCASSSASASNDLPSCVPGSPVVGSSVAGFAGSCGW